MKKIQQTFTQTTLGSIIWIAILTTIFDFPEMTILKVVALGLIAGLVFGIAYPMLWQHASFKTSTKITISALINTVAGSLAVYLASPEMFHWLQPAFIGIFALTVCLHGVSLIVYTQIEKRLIK
ncbi:hypothetical protein [Enterococcus sp.]|uniref:hypothetical protein n=1 Tax=Enterococcus sp. TaxID=35783 RepID=UPI002FC85D75